MSDGALLRRAAERAALDPFYLASSLLAYARAERLDDAGLADRLGCDPASVPALLLCRKPTGEPAMFRADVHTIAERFGLDPLRLARLLRHADMLVTTGDTPSGQARPLLAAARDREHGDHHADAPAVDDSATRPADENDA